MSGWEYGPERPPRGVTPETKQELLQGATVATERYSEVRRSYYKDKDEQQKRIDLAVRMLADNEYLLIMQEPEAFNLTRQTFIEVSDEEVRMSERITADVGANPKKPEEIETGLTPVDDQEGRVRRWLDYFEQGYDWQIERYEAEPANSQTLQALIGETFGLLDTEEHVALTHSEADVDVYKDPDQTIIVSEAKMGGRYVRETIISIMGSDSEADLTAREVITIKDSDPKTLLERKAASVYVAQQIGIYRQRLDAGLTNWILKLLRTADERIREGPASLDDLNDSEDTGA